jgi:hypothetical protein
VASWLLLEMLHRRSLWCCRKAPVTAGAAPIAAATPDLPALKDPCLDDDSCNPVPVNIHARSDIQTQSRARKMLALMEPRDPRTFAERLRRWLWPLDRDERYLAAATDPADLERRLRVIERGNGGPQFVTFNH